MTKTELIEALNGINDDEEIVFRYIGTDRNGCPKEQVTSVVQIETIDAYNAHVRADRIKRCKETIAMAEARIAKLTAEMEEATYRGATQRNATRIRTIKRCKNIIETNRLYIEMG